KKRISYQNQWHHCFSIAEIQPLIGMLVIDGITPEHDSALGGCHSPPVELTICNINKTGIVSDSCQISHPRDGYHGSLACAREDSASVVQRFRKVGLKRNGIPRHRHRTEVG